jgi:hypothetical protein
MDQAASLRELMNKIGKTQKETVTHSNSVSIISTEDLSGYDHFLRKMAVYYAKNKKTKATLLGVNAQRGLELKDYITEQFDEEDILLRLSSETTVVPGALSFIKEIRKNPVQFDKFTSFVKKIESESNYLFYYVGEGMDNTAINLALLANKIIILAKPTPKSMTQAFNLIKVFYKTNSNNSCGLVIDTSDQNVYEKQYKNLQEIIDNQFKYYIEPIGHFDFKYVSLFNENDVFRQFNFDYLNEDDDKNILSESLIRIGS